MLQTLIARFKGCRRSLTIWFNSAAASAVLAWPDVVSNFPALASYIGDTAFYRYAGAFVIGVNMVLRFRTNRDLAEK